MLLFSLLTLLTASCLMVGFANCQQCSAQVTLQATQSKTAVLTYPLNATYLPNLNCFWKLEAPGTKCIRFRFRRLSMDYGDYVQVFDDETTGSNKKINFNGYKYVTGNTHPLPYYYTNGQYALINFVSNDKRRVRGTGFSLEYTAVDCECKAASKPEELVVEMGKLATFSYPKDSKLNYQSEAVCWWNLTAPTDKCIRLRFKLLSMEDAYDYVTIYEDSTWNSNKKLNINLKSYISGTISPQSYYYVNGRSAIVAFTANANDNYGYSNHGFSLEYAAVDCECKAASQSKGIRVESGQVGTLSYPEDSSFNYKSDSVCWWNLTAPADKCIRLRFKLLSMQVEYDYITVFDDSSWNSNKKMIFNRRDYVSGFVVPNSFYYSSSRSALVAFTANADDNYGINGLHGFKLTYEAVDCECRAAVAPEPLAARSDIVQTIFYPKDNTFNYRSNSDCWWNISSTVADAKCLKLQFTFLSIQYEYDYVVIYDDSTWSSNKKIGNRGYFSGETHPRAVYYTSGRVALVRFVSNGDDVYGYNGRHGFILNYTSETDASKCGRPDTCKVCVTTCS